jgi:hypothetical protein
LSGRCCADMFVSRENEMGPETPGPMVEVILLK